MSGRPRAQFDARLIAVGFPGASSGGTCAGAVYYGTSAPPPRTLWQILEATAEEELPAMPLLPDGKADRKHLPEPASSSRIGADQAHVAPAAPGERALAGALAELLGLEQVSADSQFFDDLGLSSLRWLGGSLPAVGGRQDRPPRRHLFQDRAGLHRYADHRR